MSEQSGAPGPLLSQREVAELLGVSWETIKRWRAENYGPPSLTVGKQIRYRPEDVDAWIRARPSR